MAWIESHEDIGNHPKTYALMTALNIDKRSAVGALHLLWHFTLKFAWKDGDLTKYPAIAIARACDEPGDAGRFVQALRDCGWFDEMRVHDWMDYAGKIVRDRIYNAKRRSTPLNDVNPRKTAATVPNRTLPNLTKDSLRPVRPKVVSPADPKKLTDIQLIVEGWKELTGVDRDDKAWDKVKYPRHAKAAQSILTLCHDDVGKALDMMEHVYNWATAKKLDCTIETVIKRSDLFNEAQGAGAVQ